MMRRPRSLEPKGAKDRGSDSRAIVEALLGGLPDDRATWTDDQHVRGLVFDLLDFHRRAAKPGWWAMFARRDMTDDELIDDVECLGGLTRSRSSRRCRLKQSLVHTFAFPEQDTKLRVGKQCQRTDTTTGWARSSRSMRRRERSASRCRRT